MSEHVAFGVTCLGDFMIWVINAEYRIPYRTYHARQVLAIKCVYCVDIIHVAHVRMFYD